MPGKEVSSLTFDLSKAKTQLEEMQSEISQQGIRSCTYLFNKNMRRAIQGLYVDLNGVSKVKTMIQAGYKVIFMPLYKTFMDFFVLNYVN